MTQVVSIVPRCGNCGTSIYGLCIENSNFDTFPATINIIKRLEPSACPTCDLIFGRVEVDTDKKTVIVTER